LIRFLRVETGSSLRPTLTARRFASMSALLPMLLVVASAAAAPAIDESKVVDLSHSFDANTLHWPTAKGFTHEVVFAGKTEGGYYYSSANFALSEHCGTHMDAPVHFAEGRHSSDQVPLTQLMGPAVVIDVSEAAAKDPDYRASAADILSWEKRYGRVPKEAIVLLRTGWDARWPDRKQYMGDDSPGDASKLHFPAWAKDAAELLVEREVDAVGLDTASLDYGQSRDFIVHQVLNGANIPGLENLANLDRLPATGAFVVAAPMKIAHGTGGPVRVFAILP
jgi:kynurenine formamidase